MKENTQFFEIADIIRSIQGGEFCLPEFQRNFVWRSPRVAELLCSIARGWPAGSLLVMKTDGELKLATRAFELAPKPEDPRYYILDGQQRLTSVFHAFSGEGKVVYYLDMGKIVDSDAGFEDEHLRFEKKTSFNKKYPSVEALSQSRILPVHMIRNEEKWGSWCDHIDDKEERGRFRKLRSTSLAGLMSYRLPAVVLDKDLELGAIAKIFETVNRTGVVLKTFELMVAKLYPHEFNLKNKVKESVSANDLLALQSFGGNEALQLIALHENHRQKQHRAHAINSGTPKIDAPKVKVKGIRQGDILHLPPKAVTSRWNEAVGGVTKAYEFLQKRCGVVAKNLLPSETMVIPIAYALSNAPPREDFGADLERWYWITCFEQIYSQGANTRAVNDAHDLAAWAQNKNTVPRLVEDFEAVTFTPDPLKETKTRNQLFLKALMGLLIVNGARDWITDKPLHHLDYSERTGHKIEFHHMFSAKLLEKGGKKVVDPIANFTPMLSTTNASLSDAEPSTVFGRTDVKLPAVDTHLVDRDLMIKGGVDSYLADRRERLLDLIRAKVS